MEHNYGYRYILMDSYGNFYPVTGKQYKRYLEYLKKMFGDKKETEHGLHQISGEMSCKYKLKNPEKDFRVIDNNRNIKPYFYLFTIYNSKTQKTYSNILLDEFDIMYFLEIIHNKGNKINVTNDFYYHDFYSIYYELNGNHYIVNLEKYQKTLLTSPL